MTATDYAHPEVADLGRQLAEQRAEIEAAHREIARLTQSEGEHLVRGLELVAENQELHELLTAANERARRDKATIDTLRAQRDTANVAPRGGW